MPSADYTLDCVANVITLQKPQKSQVLAIFDMNRNIKSRRIQNTIMQINPSSISGRRKNGDVEKERKGWQNEARLEDPKDVMRNVE